MEISQTYFLVTKEFIEEVHKLGYKEGQKDVEKKHECSMYYLHQKIEEYESRNMIKKFKMITQMN